MNPQSSSVEAQITNRSSMNAQEINEETTLVVPTSHESVSVPATGKTQKQTETQMKSGPRNKGDPKDLKLRDLPSVEEILKAIGERVNINDLVKKFQKQIDETNVRLFYLILKVLCIINSESIVPRPQVPSYEEIVEIIKEAKTPSPAKPVSKPGETRTVSSSWIGPVNVTLSEYDEQIRQTSNILPPYFFRTHPEDSATLSSYVTPHTHIKYHDTAEYALQLDLIEGNAFQSLRKPTVNDLTKQRIERHLDWRQKHPPTSFISVFNSFSLAKKRAHWHYHKSTGHIGRRVSCAQISTAGIVAATVRGDIVTTTTTTRTDASEEDKPSSQEEVQNVQFPIWIRKTAIPDDIQSISLQDIIDSGAEVWLSATELSVSDVKIPIFKGNHYEWMAWGKIAQESITKIMPYDGKVMYTSELDRDVYSLDCKDPWVFDWDTKSWILDRARAQIARAQHLKENTEEPRGHNLSARRKRAMAQANVGGKDEEKGRPLKRQKPSATSDERIPDEENLPSAVTNPVTSTQDEQTTNTPKNSQGNDIANSEEFCSHLNKSQNIEGPTEETAKRSRQKEDLEISLAEAQIRIKELEGENERLRGLISKCD